MIEIDTIRQAKRDSHGRFLKGYNANPEGNNQFTSLVPLIEALNKQAKRQDYGDFYHYVAQRALINDQVLIAIMKKILPDKIEQSGEVILTVKEKNARVDRLRDYYGIQTQN